MKSDAIFNRFLYLIVKYISIGWQVGFLSQLEYLLDTY